jgi:hypothetical protein
LAGVFAGDFVDTLAGDSADALAGVFAGGLAGFKLFCQDSSFSAMSSGKCASGESRFQQRRFQRRGSLTRFCF